MKSRDDNVNDLDLPEFSGFACPEERTGRERVGAGTSWLASAPL